MSCGIFCLVLWYIPTDVSWVLTVLFRLSSCYFFRSSPLLPHPFVLPSFCLPQPATITNSKFSGKACSVALMMEAVSTSETSVNFYHTTRRSISQDGQVCACRCQNQKSHQQMKFATLKFSWRYWWKLRNPNQVIRSQGRDVKPRFPEYEAGVLTTWPQYSVTVCCVWHTVHELKCRAANTLKCPVKITATVNVNVVTDVLPESET
jgi:hypothetical protein